VPSLVRWAVDSLGCLKVEEVVPQLITLLKDERPAARWVAVVALARVGSDSVEAAAALRGALQDSDGVVREAAAWALSQVQRPARPGRQADGQL
jgi:HEAT repeat protein